MQLPLALNNATLLHLARGTRMPFDHIDAFDGQAPFLGENSQDFALLPTILPSNNFDEIILFNMPPCLWNNFCACHTISLSYLFACFQSTSGASEIIFIKPLARSSRGTGPKMRVPTGSPASLMMTAALSSKRIYVPSVRRISLRVRTITARRTSPFFTALLGRASFTDTTTTSPTLA